MAFPNILPYIMCKCFPSDEASMKRLGYPLFVLSVLLLTTTFSGCDEFISIWHGGNSGRSIALYPMQIGNRWTYNRSFYTHNYRPIDSTYQFQPFSLSYTLTVEATKQLLLPRRPGIITDLIPVTEFRTVGTDRTSPSYSYYTQSSGWLYLQGYIPSSLIDPQPAGQSQSFRLGERTFRSLQDAIRLLEEPISTTATDSITREYPPLTIIKYPLATGDQWTFRQSGRPWRIDKRTGESGWDPQFGLWYYEVRWLYDMNGDGVWDSDIIVTDRISVKGILRRRFDLLNLEVITENSPEAVGYVDVCDEYSASSLPVH